MKNTNKKQFPELLYTMLDLADLQRLGCSNAVTWLSHGYAFKILDQRELMEVAAPMFFKQTKIRSFFRQLNLWGYKRVQNGPDAGAYYHEFFLRGRPEKMKEMLRVKIKGPPSKMQYKVPDFYSMPPLPRGPIAKATTGEEPEKKYTADSNGTNHNTGGPIVSCSTITQPDLRREYFNGNNLQGLDASPSSANIFGHGEREQSSVDCANPSQVLRQEIDFFMLKNALVPDRVSMPSPAFPGASFRKETSPSVQPNLSAKSSCLNDQMGMPTAMQMDLRRRYNDNSQALDAPSSTIRSSQGWQVQEMEFSKPQLLCQDINMSMPNFSRRASMPFSFGSNVQPNPSKTKSRRVSIQEGPSVHSSYSGAAFHTGMPFGQPFQQMDSPLTVRLKQDLPAHTFVNGANKFAGRSTAAESNFSSFDGVAKSTLVAGDNLEAQLEPLPLQFDGVNHGNDEVPYDEFAKYINTTIEQL